MAVLENSARVLRNRAWISAWKKGNGAKEERERERKRKKHATISHGESAKSDERERERERGKKREWRKTSAKERRRGSNERESLVRRDGR